MDFSNPTDWLGTNCLYATSNGNEVLSFGCIPGLVIQVLNFAMAAGGTVALLIIVFGGYKLLTSGGDPKQVEGARQTITYAIIGLVIVFLSYAIINYVGYLTGATCITGFSFTACT